VNGLAFRNLFARWVPRGHRAAEHQTDYQGLDEAPATLDAEYQRLITHQLARWGVTERLVHVEVRQSGGRKTKPAFSAVLTIHGWERDPVLRVLIGLPLLEKKVRRAVAERWIADVSTFDGLLVTISPRLRDTPACTELRQLLVTITGSGPKRVKAGTAVEDADATLV